MRIIVTRPQREAQRWVRDLSALGLDAVALPLIQVGPVDDRAGLVQVWQHLADYVGVMFVSSNAVEHFFASKPPLAREFSAVSAIHPRAWATGPGTARALMREGVVSDRLDAPPPDATQFDSEALWRLVGAQVRAGDRVLIVRGGDPAGSGSGIGIASGKASAGQGTGREWFSDQVARAGGQAEFVVAYQRCMPEFSSAERQLARTAATDGSVWLFSSGQAVANLSACLPGQSWSGARAIATHPRIAAAAQQAGFGVVCDSRPTLPDVVASLDLVGQTAV